MFIGIYNTLYGQKNTMLKFAHLKIWFNDIVLLAGRKQELGNILNKMDMIISEKFGLKVTHIILRIIT